MQEIANVYARALFAAALDKGDLDKVRAQLGQFVEAMLENQSLRLFFYSPYFTSVEQKEALTKTLTGADPLLSNFLALLIEAHRMPVLPAIRSRFEELWDQE
ncbi:MAG: F0F1 ATP synthase subunit delta, partial [Solirubrobacteraceae bacterium]